jgi:hypothetical protein
MKEILLDEVDQAYEEFRKKIEYYKEYIHYLESLPKNKLTNREKEILKKHGSRKDGPNHIKLSVN